MSTNQSRRTFVWRGVAALFGANALRGPLFAGEPPPLGQQWANHQERMAALLALRNETGALHARIDSLEGRAAEFEKGLKAAEANQAQINTLIAQVSEQDRETTRILHEAIAEVQRARANMQRTGQVLELTLEELAEVRCWLKQVNCNLELTRQQLAEVNCLLQQANCILCKLPANIRRAKIRAFLFGLIVGMGIGFAAGGVAGGPASVLSVPVW